MKLLPMIRRGAFALALGLSVQLLEPAGPARAQSLEEMAVMALGIGQEDLVLKALERGANANGRVKDHTLLGHAVLKGRPGAVSTLVRRGADINLPTGPSNQQRSPLALALQTNRRDYDMFDMTLALLRLGADPKTSQAQPARTAIDFANLTLYQAVLAAGGSPSDLGPGGKMIIHFAAEAASETLRKALTGCDRSQVDRFQALGSMLTVSISEGADLAKPISARPLLSYVLSNGMFDFADAILGAGVSPTQAGSDNQRPVQIAYNYALPNADRCTGQVEEPTWRTAFRTEVEISQDKMIGRLLRSMLQAP